MPDRSLFGALRDDIVNANGILNADMTTIGAMLRDGLRWWIDELASLVPERLRNQGAAHGPRARFDGTRLADIPAGTRPVIAIAPDLCLVRTIQRPAMAPRDLARMIAMDSDRIMPMAAGSMIVAGRIVAREGPHMQIAVAGLPIAHARALVAATEAARLSPARIIIASDEGEIDFLPALREAGLYAPPRSGAALWWGLVAFLFALNIGLLIWRDSARVTELETLVAAQRPAVAAARTIGARITRGERLARAVVARRAARDPLAMLGQVSAAMPQGAWVQRLGWDGARVKLAGYRPRDTNVVTALRKAPGFAEVRNTSSDPSAEIPAGQPFDVTARLGQAR